SQADQRNLRPGDLIRQVNKVSVDTPIDFYTRLVASAAVQETTIVVQRGLGSYRVPFAKVARMTEDEER
ncbi:MAG: hypothetical protein ABGZ37_06545, partial [Akkermansiaceae bacterium]